MAHIRPSGPPQIPDLDEAAGDYVDIDNDCVVRSRRDHYIDRSDAISPALGRMQLGARLIASPLHAAESFDSEKDNYGNAGIARDDILRDSSKW